MTSNLAQYSGRKIDVLAFRGASAEGEKLLSQSLADSDTAGEICTGIQKLAQRFLIALLNETGSVKYFPAQGSGFMTALRQGRVHNETDMQAVFALAEQEAAVQLVGEETDDMPTDERYRSAELESLTVTPGFASIKVQLRSQAEDGTATFILPIPIVV